MSNFIRQLQTYNNILLFLFCKNQGMIIFKNSYEKYKKLKLNITMKNIKVDRL